MAEPTSMLHVRVDSRTKLEAAETLAAIGMSVSKAVRLFLHRVVADQAFPLELNVPNAATRAGMAEANQIARLRSTRFASADPLFDDLEKAGKR